MDQYQKLLAGCLKLLGIRLRSEKEIVDYLSKKTSDDSLILEVVHKLKSQHLINDEQFATWLIESRSRSRPRGTRLLKEELKRRGIQTSVEVDEMPLAIKAISKKLPMWKNLSYRDFYAKAAQFLQYRGFSWGVIEKVIKKEYNELHVN